jgi:WD40 repeat protein
MLAMGETRVYVYDFVTREKIGEWKLDKFKMTSITISQDSKYALVSMNPSKIHLIEIESGNTVQVYEGHKQENVIIRSAFGGATGAFVISGSEGEFLVTHCRKLATNEITDSKIFVWRTRSGQMIEIFPGHGHGCVNAVAWHPTNPAYFASAGDDGRVKM